MFQIDENFQTPPVVAKHMADMVYYSWDYSNGQPTILEPTPGKGNLVRALEHVGKVRAPEGDFWASLLSRFVAPYNYVVLNPPFNPVPDMMRFMHHAMNHSDNVIALLPWSYIVNSESRLQHLQEYGLVSITNLPRKTFPGCRVQTAIFELKKGYSGQTTFKSFTW